MSLMKPSIGRSASFLPFYFLGMLCLLGGTWGVERVMFFLAVGSDLIVRPAKSAENQLLTRYLAREIFYTFSPYRIIEKIILIC